MSMSSGSNIDRCVLCGGWEDLHRPNCPTHGRLQERKAAQVDPGPPPAPDSSAGVAADVAVEASPPTTPGRRPEEFICREHQALGVQVASWCVPCLQAQLRARGSEKLLIETLAAMVRRAGREVRDRTLRQALEDDLVSLLKYHGLEG
jgi:hypothetical protein